MKPALLAVLLASAAAASVNSVHPSKPSVTTAPAPPTASCSLGHPPAGFAFPTPGVEVFLDPSQFDTSAAARSRCGQTAARAAQQYGEQVQAAFQEAWPKVGTAVLATVEHVNIASQTPALVKFCFVENTLTGGKSIACGEVVYSLARGTVELKLAGRDAVTSAARVPIVENQNPAH